MRGTMMNFPLTLPTILERSGKIFPRVEIVSRKPDKSINRTCYGEFSRRARRLAAALTKLGLRPGDRVASMMWNHAGHLEAFFGVPCAGGILHTLELRLHPHEIAGIAKQAGDRFLLIDDVLLPLYEKFREDVSFERIIVVPYGCGTLPEGFLNYEELLAEADDNFRYPQLDENDGAALCFTSGTTGHSKGVIYSHRALVLHSFACGLGEVFGMSHFDTVLPVAPMFHANAWGLPFACTMLGARLVLPGPSVDPESVLGLMVSERVSIACGVPTVWIAVLEALEKNPGRWKFDAPVRIVCGGTAPPLELIRRLDRYGLQIKHLWGMTETTPIGTSGGLRPHMHEAGYVKIVDRAKDLVKSGGEWISSVDLENTLMGHPAVKEACVVGIPHPKWQERPLAAVVLKDGAQATPEELRAFLAQSFAKWQLPDAFVFIDAIPRTSVGKFKKLALREQFADWKWES